VEWVEVVGKTIEEAKDQALDHLGIDESQAEFEIVEEPRSGFLGLRRSQARVRARVKPRTPRPKAERRDRRRRSGPGRDTKRSGRGGARTGAGRRSVASESAKRSSRAAAGGEDAADGSTGGRARRSRSRSSSGEDGRPGRGRSGAPGSTPELDPAVMQRADDELYPDDLGDDDDYADEYPTRNPDLDYNDPEVQRAMEEATQQQVEAVEEFLNGLLDSFDLDGSVEYEMVSENTAEFRVHGDDLGLLIGARAATLDAVQELARMASRRQTNGTGDARIRVDIGGYREKRRAALTKFAVQVAQDVLSSGKQKILEPMTAPDRKVVHDAVTDIEGVGTRSEGEDPYRRVVIVPA